MPAESLWQLTAAVPQRRELGKFSCWLAPALQSRDRFRLLSKLQRSQKTPMTQSQWQQWRNQAEKSLRTTQLRQRSLPQLSYPELPVSERADEIAALLAKHQVIIVAGATGSVRRHNYLKSVCKQAAVSAE